ncbi:hypothetical protein KSP39_PZI018386 [Platanthera zijinensis]|uniref:Uncharacterized protein n=1 Tax=Platanthera zijinensis TaxID=2320716 RepID=A0AAP0B4A9_9ASPA
MSWRNRGKTTSPSTSRALIRFPLFKIIVPICFLYAGGGFEVDCSMIMHRSLSVWISKETIIDKADMDFLYHSLCRVGRPRDSHRVVSGAGEARRRSLWEALRHSPRQWEALRHSPRQWEALRHRKPLTL